MKKLTLLAAAFYVSGCATVPEAPPPIVTKVVVQKVPVPFPVACLAADSVPVLPVPTAVDVDNANPRQIAAALAADFLALERYALNADPLLRQCAAIPEGKP